MRTATHGVLLVPKDDPLRALLVRMAGTFVNQPTLRLTLPQAQRLWNLDAKTCNEHADRAGQRPLSRGAQSTVSTDGRRGRLVTRPFGRT